MDNTTFGTGSTYTSGTTGYPLTKPTPSPTFSLDMQGSKNILGAMLQAKSNMTPVLKTKKNLAFGANSKYADLASVFEAIDDAVNAAGIVVLQPYRYEAGPDGKTVLMLYTCVAHAESGEALVSFAPITVANLVDVQKVGSYMTYFRRYMLLAMFGLAPEDDDGNAASGVGNAPASPSRPAPKPAALGPNKTALKSLLHDKGAKSKADVKNMLAAINVMTPFDSITEDEAPDITKKLGVVSGF